jgi:hypothetical protein
VRRYQVGQHNEQNLEDNEMKIADKTVLVTGIPAQHTRQIPVFMLTYQD